MNPVISSYCKIKNNAVCINGKELVIDNNETDLTTFLTNLYRQVNLNYPKFFKMDNLCKLGMLAAELAIRNSLGFNRQEKEKIAIVLSNSASSLDTDRNHLKTIIDKTQYFPSPAVFVYTLPNIVIGEIAIKHKITGENAFFVADKFEPELMHNYVSTLLENSHTIAALGGWINVDGNEYDAFVYCAEKSNFNLDNEEYIFTHSTEILRQLYYTII